MSESALSRIYELIEKSQNNKSVGRMDALIVAQIQTDVLFSHVNFDNVKTVLDYGCGIGRTMPMLFERTNRSIALDGCDISKQFIDECRKLYSEYPFRFFKIFAENPHYMKFLISRQEDALPVDYYDLAYSFSVFTHLNLKMADETLRRIVRYLKPGGIYFFTMFRIDDESFDLINSGKSSAFSFSNRIKNGAKEYFAHDKDPFAFVALDRTQIEQTIEKAGFEVRQFTAGAWRGNATSNIHDSYTLVKK